MVNNAKIVIVDADLRKFAPDPRCSATVKEGAGRQMREIRVFIVLSDTETMDVARYVQDRLSAFSQNFSKGLRVS